MIANQLMLNDNKTEVLHLTSRFTSAAHIPSLRVGEVNVTPSTSARDLGVVIDDHVTMSDHVSSVCRSVSFALYNIGKLRMYLDKASAEILVHAFVTSRLDSCSSLLHGLPQKEFKTPPHGLSLAFGAASICSLFSSSYTGCPSQRELERSSGFGG